MMKRGCDRGTEPPRSPTTQSYADQLAHARQRLLDVEASLRVRLTIDTIKERSRLRIEIKRLRKLARKEANEQLNEEQCARLIALESLFDEPCEEPVLYSDIADFLLDEED
jgi:hypothetical protein